MQLTPEQQELVQQAKARGERRVSLQFTPEQRTEWRELVDSELAGKGENLAHIRNLKAAAEQPGFFGDVRRAIMLSRSNTSELAKAIGVETRQLSDFQAGKAELPAAALDRLLNALGLRLMQEIPH